jgi:hypothetical protein
MYSRKTMTHHRSQDDAGHHFVQHERQALWPAHIPSVFRADHASIDAALSANEMI